MKIAVFHPQSFAIPWSMGPGLVETLERGNTVYSGELPTQPGEMSDEAFAKLKEECPLLSTLEHVDVIILVGPEMIVPWLDVIYGKYEWKQLKAAKLAWYINPFFGQGVSIDFDVLKYWADEHFFVAIQDAEFHDQECFAKEHSHWLPFGVDTEMFDSIPESEKTWPVAYEGYINDHAGKYLQAVAANNPPVIRYGKVLSQDLSGFDAAVTARRLAGNLRRVGVYFNLPQPQMLEARVFEVLACGTFLMTPMLSGDRGASKNQSLFENGKHLVFYRPSNVPGVAKQLRDWSSEENFAAREAIALAGCQEVHSKHSLDKRIEAMFAAVGLKHLVQ